MAKKEWPEFEIITILDVEGQAHRDSDTEREGSEPVDHVYIQMSPNCADELLYTKAFVHYFIRWGKISAKNLTHYT